MHPNSTRTLLVIGLAVVLSIHGALCDPPPMNGGATGGGGSNGRNPEPMNGSNNGQNNGLNNGQNNGMNSGMNNVSGNGQNNGMNNVSGNGQNNGQNNGMNNGQNNQMNNGMNNGMNTGQTNGMNNVQSNGQSNGQNNGMNNGQNNGMNTGQNNVMDNGMDNNMNNRGNQEQANNHENQGQMNYQDSQDQANNLGNSNDQSNYQNGYGNDNGLLRIPLRYTRTEHAGDFGQPIESYFGTIAIGEPIQPFSVQFDTSFSQLILPHRKRFKLMPNMHHKHGFRCSKSRTCRKEQDVIKFYYNDVEMEGNYVHDTIKLLEDEHIAPDRQVHLGSSFISVRSADKPFSKLPIDGFFGLGPPPDTKMANYPCLVRTLSESGVIEHAMFSFWFNWYSDPSVRGELILGGVDPNYYEGEIAWHTLPYDNKWALKTTGVAMGSITFSCQSECPLVFNTAVSDIYGPRDDVKRLQAMLNTRPNSNGLAFVDCNRMADKIPISFVVDGVPIQLSAEKYIKRMKVGILGSPLLPTEKCYVAVLPSENYEWVLGTNFFQEYYSVYDLEAHRIGLAKRKG